MIPRKIHYIWVGSAIPFHVQQLIEKNSQFLDNFEVTIWTEENMPRLNAFAQRAYEDKKWAFVSDYLRFYILYHEGGIYLDTDMEVLKPLDDLTDCSFFSGWDRTKRYIYTGIIGAEPNNECIQNVLESYNRIDDRLYPTSPEILTECYREYHKQEKLSLLGSEYFYPLLDGEKPSKELLEKAYTNHLWHESWRSYVPLRRFLRRAGIMKLYHDVVGTINRIFHDNNSH